MKSSREAPEPRVSRRWIRSESAANEFVAARFLPGKGMDVRPHPHIGLAT